MADVKISGLPASTLPLAGTEVLPLVQSGVTKQVSIANVTAGRAVAALSVTTPTIQAEAGSAGGTIKNGSGVAQMQWGSGGASNLSLEVATNINPANAAVSISPTGTGTVTIAPATASTMNNVAIGGTTPLAGNFTTLGATGVATFSAGTVSAPAITTTGDTNTGIYFPAADTIAFTEGGVESMRIDSSGNVGIGTSSPDTKLVIDGAFDNSSSKAGNNPNKGLTITSSAAGSNNYARGNEFGIVFATNNGGATDYSGAGIMAIPIVSASFVGADLVFQTHTSSTSTLEERMRIDSSGNLLVGITTARANAGDVQVSKGISFPATQAASSDANTLDDYEEGTWTPVLAGTTTAGTYVYDTARTGGQYIKIGKQVTVRGSLRVSSVTSAGSGSAIITGAPFTSPNVSPSWAITPGNLGVSSGATLATNSLFLGFSATGSTSMYLYTQSTSTITSIPVTDADEVNAIWFFTYVYFTDN